MAQGTPQALPGTADPDFFQKLLNMMSSAGEAATGFIGANRGMLGTAARYAPGGLIAADQLAQGQIGGAIGAGVGAYGLGQVMKRVAGGIPATGPAGMLAKGALYAGGSLLGGSLGSQLGRGVQGGLGQLVGGTQTAVGDAAAAIAGTQREAGTAAGTGKEAGLGGMSQQEYNQLMALKQFGVNAPAEALERSFQVVNKMKDRDAGRQMQMNQQLAGLTAQLQRNLGGMQLAGQAMNVGGALTGQMLTSNPYAASVLQTGAIRGPMG